MTAIHIIVIDGDSTQIRVFDNESDANEYIYNLEDGLDFKCVNWWTTVDGKDQVAIYRR